MNQLILNAMQDQGHSPYLKTGSYTCYNVLGDRDPATMVTIPNGHQIYRCFLSLIFETHDGSPPKAFLEVTPRFVDARENASDQFRMDFSNGRDDVHVRLINFNALLINGVNANQLDIDSWISTIYVHISELIFGQLNTPNATWPHMRNRPCQKPGQNWQNVRDIIALIPNH